MLLYRQLSINYLNMQLHFKATLATICIIILNLSALGQQSDFNISIDRKRIEGNLVYCSISLNGELIGMAYENNALKIQAGDYKGVMRYNSGKNFVQSSLGKMSTKGDFLIEVSGVYGRTDILLHGGNAPQYSTGCIMLGPVKKMQDGTGLIEGDLPLRKLRIAFYGSDEPVSCPNKNIKITISENYLEGEYFCDEIVETSSPTKDCPKEYQKEHHSGPTYSSWSMNYPLRIEVNGNKITTTIISENYYKNVIEDKAIVTHMQHIVICTGVINGLIANTSGVAKTHDLINAASPYEGKQVSEVQQSIDFSGESYITMKITSKLTGSSDIFQSVVRCKKNSR